MWLTALLMVIMVPLVVLLIPLVAIWTHHKRKMEELRLQRNVNSSAEIQAEFASVRAEIKSLRDTAMQYDLSFDSNLQQLERRLAHMEQNSLPAAAGQHQDPDRPLYQELQRRLEQLERQQRTSLYSTDDRIYATDDRARNDLYNGR